MAAYTISGLIGIRGYQQYGTGDTFGQGTINNPSPGAPSSTGPGSFADPGNNNFGLGTIPTSGQSLWDPGSAYKYNALNQGSGSGAGSGGSGSGSGGKKKDNPPDAKDRKEEIKKRSKKEKDKKLLEPPKPGDRVKSVTSDDPPKYLGVKEMDQGGQSSSPADSFLSDDLVNSLQGMVQNMAAQVPAMQQIMSMVPNELFNQFLGNLPAGFQSLLPIGTIAGAGLGTENPSNSINLNALLQFAAGGALGPEANQILNSLLPGVDLSSAISQLGSLPLQSLNNQALGMPNSSATDAALALSNMQQLVGLASNMGIPLDPAAINQAYAIGLQSLGLAQSIPAALSNLPMDSLMGGLLNGSGIPMITPDMATGFSSALLSGLPQNITGDLARSIFSADQLTNLLPNNLQNLIPPIAPLISTGAENTMSSIANAAPQQVPNSESPGGGNGNQGCKTEDPLNDGKVNENTRNIDYTQMLSKNFSLHSLTIGSGIEPGKNMLNGDDVPKVVKNLSGLATNVLEPLKMKYPGFTILSGWRQGGDGKSVDVGWGVAPAKLTEIADYIQQSIPAAEVKVMQQKTGWLNIKYEEGKCGAKASTMSPGGQSTSALVDYYSNTHHQW